MSWLVLIRGDEAMKRAEAEAVAGFTPRLLLTLFGVGNVHFAQLVQSDPATSQRRVVIHFLENSLEQFGKAFKAITLSVAENDGIPIPKAELGIHFEKRTVDGSQIIIVTSILRLSYLWYDDFRSVVREEQLGGETSWVTFLYLLKGDTSLWIKVSMHDSSKIYVGGFSDLDQVGNFVTAICDSDLPFQGIGILDLRRRPWNKQLEFPGKYAIVIAYS